jgi:superfamily I DNA/RNA helicase
LDRDSVNNYKTRNLLEQHLDVNMRSFAKENPVFVQAVEEMVRLCKLTLTDPTEEALAEMAIQFDIELGRDREWVFATVPIILELARTETKEIDFADQVWLPVVNNLPLPSVGLLLLDEAQDTNRCSQELAIRIGERLVVCGDINQAIYGFAGADTESIPRLANSLGESTRGVQRLPLTETRRCGKAIVTEAAKLVPAFTAHESNPPGLLREIQARELQGQLVDGDMVLCRVNAPLIGLAFALLRSGRKAEIQGRSIGDGLKATIKRSLADTVGEFLKWLDDYHNTERNRLNERKNPPEQAIVALGDRVACLQTFCHGTKTLKEVEASIDAIFKDNTKGGILLSSGHRAKGLEAKRVFILEPELIPHPMAKSESAQAQELNLKYVMQTRAIEELITVYGDEKEA